MPGGCKASTHYTTLPWGSRCAFLAVNALSSTMILTYVTSAKISHNEWVESRRTPSSRDEETMARHRISMWTTAATRPCFEACGAYRKADEVKFRSKTKYVMCKTILDCNVEPRRAWNFHDHSILGKASGPMYDKERRILKIATSPHLGLQQKDHT